MPKKTPKNAFFFFMLDFKRKEENRGRRFVNGLADVSAKASPFWNKMTPQEKGIYEKQAKDAKVAGSAGRSGERYTSQGVAFSEVDRLRGEIERAESEMQRDINRIVKESYQNNTIATREYVFVAGNFFCKTMTSNIYVPAELSLLKYTLESGYNQKYHTFINPGQLPAGYAYEAKEYSKNSHQLPPPPNAMGERSYTKIMHDILNFLGVKKAKDLPPLYSDAVQVPIIKSFINQLCQETDDDPANFRIYPLAQLFFVLKNESCKFALDERDAFHSIHIAQAMIERDQYDYRRDISCMFHEEADANKFCALSHVIRWAFIFSDHLCVDLGIELIPGKHIPVDSDIKVGVKLKADLDETRSMMSEAAASECSYADSDVTTFTQARWFKNDNDSISGFSCANAIKPDDEDFPSINGSSGRRKMKTEPGDEQSPIHRQDEDNPWMSRNRNVARSPLDSSLSFSVAGRGCLDQDKVRSAPSAPMGRGKFY